MAAQPGTIPALPTYQPGALPMAGTEALEIVNTTNATAAASYLMFLTDLVGKTPSVMTQANPAANDRFAFTQMTTGLPRSCTLGDFGVPFGNMPTGGGTGAVLAKNSATDFDASFTTALSIANMTVTNLTAVTGTITNLTVTNLTASAATVTNISASTVTATNLRATTATATNLAVTNLTAGAATATSLSVTNLTASTGTVTSLTVGNLSATSLTTVALAASNLTTSNLAAATGTVTGLTVTNLTASSLRVTTAVIGTAVITSFLQIASNTAGQPITLLTSNNTKAGGLDSSAVRTDTSFGLNVEATGNVNISADIDGSGGSQIIFKNNNEAERGRMDDLGNFVWNTAAISTAATTGFLYLPTCAGTPTGTPTTYAGRSAVVYDTTNNKFWIYNGAWKGAAHT